MTRAIIILIFWLASGFAAYAQQPVTVVGTAPVPGNCVQWFSTTQIKDPGITCNGGAGTSPGGSSGQVQFNNSGTFGGLTNTQLIALVQPALRTRLTATTTFFVNGDNTNAQTCGTSGGSSCAAGNDSNNCLTPATACLTAQHAINLIINTIDTAGQTALINAAHCTGANCTNYVMSCSQGPWIGTSAILFTGDSSAPTAVKIIPGPAGTGVSVKDQCTIELSNMAFADNATNNAGVYIQVGGGNYGHVDVFTVAFGACAICGSVQVTYGGSVAFTDSGSSSTGSKVFEFLVANGGVIDFGSVTFAGSSSLTYSEFVEILSGGIINALSTTFTGFSSVTGKRCVILGPYDFATVNPNKIFPGNSDCVTINYAGALGVQTGSGGSSSFDYGTAGHALLSGGSSSAKDTWDTAGVSCTLTTVSHLTVVNGIVTLCN
jgi:hypothetical protein